MKVEGTAPLFVEIGAGELMDRATILAIKNERIADPAKRANVGREWLALESARTNLLGAFPALGALEAELKAINEALWDIEDAIGDARRTATSGRGSSNSRAPSIRRTTGAPR